jgi:HD-GYP domain-containing protein (c-di-GMP phosphodiesterase class II)
MNTDTKYAASKKNQAITSGARFLEGNVREGDGQGAEEVLLALAVAVEQRDNVTAGHCERLALTGLALGMSLSLDQESLLALYRAGYLHDIGKVGIPDAILLKPAKLTPEEWDVMKDHPARGAEICRHLRSLAPVVPVIRHHHEKWDGSGYPDGLRGTQIPLLARILQVTDIYDALTNTRCYKPAFTAKQAIAIIEDETARGWRDPQIVTQFLRIHKDVLAPIVDYTHKSDCSLMALRSALVNLSPLMKPVSTFMIPKPLEFPVGPAS